MITCMVLLFTCAFAVTANAASIKAPKVKAYNISSTGKIKVDWPSVDNAAKYKVYRSTSSNGSFKLVKTVSSSKYTDTSAKAGKCYYYYVRAVTKSGKTSSKSNVVKRYCDLKQPTVSSTINVASSGKIKLKWDAIDGAVSYKVYRAASKSGDYVLMKTTTGNSYINTTAKAGKYYYYKVRAISSSSSSHSAYSKVVSRTCDLPRPVVTVALNSKGVPKLTWDAVDGAVKYEVYRSTNKTSGYELMKTTTGTSYTNTNVSLDCTYYYKVKAIHSKSSANSAYSAVDSIKTNQYEKRYVLLHSIYVYDKATSSSKSTRMPYMAEFDLGKTVHDYSSGKWYNGKV